MKKISVYFTDPQYQVIEAKATQVGVTFAEALRRVLDEWLAAAQGDQRMSQEHLESVEIPNFPTSHKVVPYAYVMIRNEDGGSYERSFRNAWIEFDEHSRMLSVRRLGQNGRIIAQFSESDISSWFQDDDESEDDA